MCSLLAWTKEEARLFDILIYWEDALLTPHALRSFARGAPILLRRRVLPRPPRFQNNVTWRSSLEIWNSTAMVRTWGSQAAAQ